MGFAWSEMNDPGAQRTVWHKGSIIESLAITRVIKKQFNLMSELDTDTDRGVF